MKAVALTLIAALAAGPVLAQPGAVLAQQPGGGEAPPPKVISEFCAVAPVARMARLPAIKVDFRVWCIVSSCWFVSCSMILGAGLAIIFRGGHLLVSVLLSFLPSVIALVFIVAGRNLVQNPNTEGVGIMIVWLSNAIVIGLDALVLGRFLRR